MDIFAYTGLKGNMVPLLRRWWVPLVFRNVRIVYIRAQYVWVQDRPSLVYCRDEIMSRVQMFT